jgi:hypothetical protein
MFWVSLLLSAKSIFIGQKFNDVFPFLRRRKTPNDFRIRVNQYNGVLNRLKKDNYSSRIIKQRDLNKLDRISDIEKIKYLAKFYLDSTGIIVDFINSNYDDSGNLLLAPNGKPSNLTPEQHKLVRSPEFKAWFGDWENDPTNASKVVDENGEPLVVYHGTNSNFTIFKTKKRLDSINNPLYESGVWFFAPSFDKQISAEERDYYYEEGNAEYMAKTFMGNKDDKGNYIDNKVIKVFLNVRNPNIIDGVTDRQAESLKYYSQEMRKLKNNERDRGHKILTVNKCKKILQ